MKQENLQHIVRPHLIGASDYLFVALTDDEDNAWRTVDEQYPNLLPFLAEPLSPDSPESGKEWHPRRNAWTKHRKDFGWIGFRPIEDLMEGGRYFSYARIFLDANRRARRRARTPRSAGGEVQNIVPNNWNVYPDNSPTIQLRDRLRNIIKEVISDNDGLRYQRENGSDSLIGLGEQRLIKLITPIRPYQDYAILLGVSVDTPGLPEALRDKSEGVIGIRNRGFEIVGISEGDFDDDGLKDLIRDIIANITDQPEGDCLE